MKKLWQKNAFAILVGGYLLGFVSLPGLFWHRTCATEDRSERLTCTAYATLIWPAALTGVGLFLVAKTIFYQWAPVAQTQNQG